MDKKIRLLSHKLCPYVQRAAIVLLEKGVPFERINIDLSNKPEWFLSLSPMGKTPALQIDEDVIFESAIICEYLDEVYPKQMHPSDHLLKAQHRGWIEFGSQFLNEIARFYTASNQKALVECSHNMKRLLGKIEHAVKADVYFHGEHFCLVDACWAPIFRYFDVFDKMYDFEFFTDTPKLRLWRAQLAMRPSVIAAVDDYYGDNLLAFLINKNTAITPYARVCLANAQ